MADSSFGLSSSLLLRLRKSHRGFFDSTILICCILCKFSLNILIGFYGSFLGLCLGLQKVLRLSREPKWNVWFGMLVSQGQVYSNFILKRNDERVISKWRTKVGQLVSHMPGLVQSHIFARIRSNKCSVYVPFQNKTPLCVKSVFNNTTEVFLDQLVIIGDS